MCWIFDVKIVALKDTCSVGGGPAMNMIITRVPVLNGPELGTVGTLEQLAHWNSKHTGTVGTLGTADKLGTH